MSVCLCRSCVCFQDGVQIERVGISINGDKPSCFFQIKECAKTLICLWRFEKPDEKVGGWLKRSGYGARGRRREGSDCERWCADGACA